jgi:hypothetical protein
MVWHLLNSESGGLSIVKMSNTYTITKIENKIPIMINNRFFQPSFILKK